MEVKEKRDFSQQLESFETDGYAIFRKVLDPQLVSEASSHIDWLLEKNPELRPEQLHHDLMTDDPFWVRLISDPRLLDIAEAFIGPNIALFASHYIAKPPLSGQSVLWHQDGSYWPLEPMEVVTLWLAVDDSDVENGCMRVIPGTQHERLLTEEELESHDDGTNVLGTGMHVDEINEAKAVDIVLKAGDGPSGAATTAMVDTVTNDPFFTNAAIDGNPLSFTIQQDAGLDTQTQGPPVEAFGLAGTITGMDFALQVDDGHLVLFDDDGSEQANITASRRSVMSRSSAY